MLRIWSTANGDCMTVVALGAVINHTSQRSCCANWLKNCSPEVDLLYCMWKSLKRGLEEQFSSGIWPIIGFHVGFPSVPVSAEHSQGYPWTVRD